MPFQQILYAAEKFSEERAYSALHRTYERVVVAIEIMDIALARI